MSIFRKLADSFSDAKTTRADEDRDQVIREAKKRTRLLNDGDWIKSKPEESQHMAADVNYGKSALNQVKPDESLNRDPSKTSNLRSTTKSDTIDGRKRDTSSTTDLSKTQRASTLDRPTSSSEPAHGHHENVVLSRHRSEEILNRNTGSTDISPTSKYSSLERNTRTSSYKIDDLPKMTIISSETKLESPTSKGIQNRPSPDGQVTRQEKSPAKTILKWGSQKDVTSGNSYVPKTSTPERNTTKTSTKAEPESLIDLTPTTESTSKGSDLISKAGSKSLIDLSFTPEKTSTGSPVATTTTPVRTSSLIELSPSTPAKSKRNSGEWDNTSYSSTTSTKTTFDPTSRKSRNAGDRDESNSYTVTSTQSTLNPRNSSGDWDELNSYTTTSTKTTFNPRNLSNSEDWGNANSYTTTSTKTIFDPNSRASRRSGDWENTSSTITTITKTSPDPILKSSSSTSEQALPEDDSSAYKSPISYTKTRRTSSSSSLNDKSPVGEPERNNSQSSYKENSSPTQQISDDDAPPSYRPPSYTPQKNSYSSSSLSDGKIPAKVISLTTAFTSAQQRSTDKNLCSQCYKPINQGAKMILEELNINCHAACFKCQICNSSLENLSAGDNFWVHHRTVHCEPCYDKLKMQRSY
ncbi:sciellin isoform X3 [Carcharodon carcharias]|uniref:sciellin isoform X3 n=1 Tax=Carcharodon carcharias TaxID=13397 RepID=UPI001B7EC16D|nr:sciellin isoform X3 [Carcharodon carcharias]